MYHGLVKMTEKEIGVCAANLTLMEVGIGSALHAWHIPFTGHFLSLNQAGILTSVAKKQTKLEAMKSVMQVSLIAALLKSLSPAGKKLTPMLALSMQGILFAVGIGIGGVNQIGAALSGALLSLWAFVQPILLYALLFGKNGLTILDFYLEKLMPAANLSLQNILLLLAGGIVLKVLLAICLCVIAYKYNYRLPFSLSPKPQKNSPSFLRKIFRSALKPSFIFPILFTAIFLFWSNTSAPEAVFFILRPIAVGIALLIFVEIFPWHRLVWLQKKAPRFSRALTYAREEVTRSRS